MPLVAHSSLYFDDDAAPQDAEASPSGFAEALSSGFPPGEADKAIRQAVAALNERLETQLTPTHARLVLAGLRSNELARRTLALCASFPSSEKLPLGQVGVLLGVSRSRWRPLLQSLRACGALVPMTLWPEQEDVLCTLVLAQSKAATYKERSQCTTFEESVERVWCRTFGVMLNPEVAALVREEIAGTYT